MKISDKIIALVLALCAIVAGTAALAAPAGAETYGNGFKVAKFKVEVKGWQRTVQQRTHLAADPCDYTDSSSGSEKVTFRSTKPVVITVTSFPGEQANPEFFAGRRLGIPTKATIKRSFTPNITNPAGAGCEENGGGVENVTQPDCGTKTVSPYLVNLQYEEKTNKNLLLTTDSGKGDPFVECPGAASMSFPYLIVEDGHANFIHAELPEKDLFDPDFQKWISIARGSEKFAVDDYWAKATIHWEVSFTRLKEKPASRG